MNARRRRLPRYALAGLVMLAAVAVLLLQDRPASGQAADPVRLSSTCPPSRTPGALDWRDQTLTQCNFVDQDLRQADFRGAKLTAVSFVRANLHGADFSGATFEDSGDALLPNDFTLADLSQARFAGALFKGTTYLTDATLTCADFSTTDISRPGSAVFGRTLRMAKRDDCKLSLRSATLNCEFVDQWPQLDLSNSLGTRACIAEWLASGAQALDFSDSLLRGADFSGLPLDGWKFAKADLSTANFTGSSLQGADLRSATLYGATLDRANLTGANLAGAFLTNQTSPSGQPGFGPILLAASLRGAHLKNANLSRARLTGTDFTGANFYSDNAGPCDGAGNGGFTRGCASAAQADLTNAIFTGAYLYGVDFTSTTVAGTRFEGAVLIAATFAGSTFDAGPDGQRNSFRGAHLQGTQFDGIELKCFTPGCHDLSDAFLDFSGNGGTIDVLLDGSHNRFAGCPSAGGGNPPCNQPVCVSLFYNGPSTVPSTSTSLVCPDGNPANRSSGCGASTGSPDARWRSSLWDSMQVAGTRSGAISVFPAWQGAFNDWPAPSTTSELCLGNPETTGW